MRRSVSTPSMSHTTNGTPSAHTGTDQDARIEPDYIVAVTERLQVTNMRELGSEPDILDHQVVKTDLLGHRSGQKIIGGKCHLSRQEADVVVVVIDARPGNINLVG